MKNLLILIIIISSPHWGWTQVCGTPNTANPTIYSSVQNARVARSSSCTVVNVFFHVVRNSNGTNAFTPHSTDTIVKNLNRYFNPHDIFINNAGTDYIDNSAYLNLTFSEARTLSNSYNVNNAINYYMVVDPAGYGGFVLNPIPSRALFIKYRFKGFISAHELGHTLNLHHTFRGTAPNTGGCPEAINGSNCNTCGDLVCDTPADQDSGNTNDYRPDLTNIMSYYRPIDHFTAGQGQRMRTALAVESTLSGVLVPKLSGSSTVCKHSHVAYTLVNGGSSVTWRTSSNLQIVSSSNTGVTVKPISSAGVGSGFVEAALSNGIALRKAIYILKKPVLSFPNTSLSDTLLNGGSSVINNYYTTHSIRNGDRIPFTLEGSSISKLEWKHTRLTRIESSKRYRSLSEPDKFTC